MVDPLIIIKLVTKEVDVQFGKVTTFTAASSDVVDGRT